MLTLEEILQKYFNCSKPFLSKRKVIGHESDGTPCYEYFTKSGGAAYEQLVDLIYALEKLDVGINANDVIETLDDIVVQDY